MDRWRGKVNCGSVFGLGLIVALAGCRSNISGSYLAIDQSSIVWLQLVRTPDNHLTGQLTLTQLKQDGNIDRSSVSVTGAVDRENVTLSAGRFLGLETVTLSGTLDGDVLSLTGMEPIPLRLKRSTLAQYQLGEQALDGRSKSLIQAKATAQGRQRAYVAQANFIADVDRLVGKMRQFDSDADVHLARFPNVEKTFQAITSKSAAYVSRERQLAGNQNAAVARGQLSVTVNQLSIQTDQLHNQVESLRSNFEGNVKPLGEQANAFQQQCNVISSNSGRLNPAEIQNINSACQRLQAAVGLFRRKYNAISTGLSHLEQVYQQETAKQQKLLRQSEQLQ